MADKAQKKARAAAAAAGQDIPTLQPQKLDGQERAIARAVVAGVFAHALLPTAMQAGGGLELNHAVDRAFELADYFLSRADL